VRAGSWVRSGLRDGRTLAHLAAAAFRRGTHQEYLERFYRPQADDYDRFRSRLLHGREQLFAALPIRDGGVWVDVGAGTCSNLLCLGSRVPRLGRFVAVDLAEPLLAIGRRRCLALGWHNVEFVVADASSATLLEGVEADVVTFSYSLTMIPDWWAALARAHALLRPGGHIGVVDFYVSRRQPPAGWTRHAWLTRRGWPAWFAWSRVRLHAEHLPTLTGLFEPVSRVEATAPVPYLLGLRVPYYRFVGQKPVEARFGQQNENTAATTHVQPNASPVRE
jgi:S-adenosylmethionine-diacylgycerolhomoserine-N-methlytransferase